MTADLEQRLEYHVGNPSAWDQYDAGVSELIREAAALLRSQAEEIKELQTAKIMAEVTAFFGGAASCLTLDEQKAGPRRLFSETSGVWHEYPDDASYWREVARRTAEQRDAQAAEIASLKGENARLAHFKGLRDRQLELQRRYWLRDAEEALAGDLRAIRNRVEMAKLEPVDIVQSGAAPSTGGISSLRFASQPGSGGNRDGTEVEPSSGDWRLVPTEPTEAMLAPYRGLNRTRDTRTLATRIYRDMLAAAPPEPDQ